MSNSVVGFARIKRHHLPAAMTDTLQLLDRHVFGILKSHARRLFRPRVRDDPMLRCRRQDTAEDMVRAWNLVSATTLAAGWEISEGESREYDPERLYIIEENDLNEGRRLIRIAQEMSLVRGGTQPSIHSRSLFDSPVSACSVRARSVRARSVRARSVRAR
jgi:hypothetical protein